MSFHADQDSNNFNIHCDVCGERINTQEDGHVNWNETGPFIFNHYRCADPDIFDFENFERHTDIGSWLYWLNQGCPSEHPPTDPLKVSLEDWLEEKRQEWEIARYNEKHRIIFEKARIVFEQERKEILASKLPEAEQRRRLRESTTKYLRERNADDTETAGTR